MAFQPIVDAGTRQIYAYEALVRGLKGEGAASVLSQVTEANRYVFDQTCRVRAVELAARLEMPCRISINFMPNAVYQPSACLRTTLEVAQRVGLPTDRIIFEITENERVVDKDHLLGIVREYQRHGFKTAIDDFGAGYSGLNLLAEFQPDIIKLDMALLRDIDRDTVRQAIVSGILTVCRDLGIDVIAEGIETAAEYQQLRAMGVAKFQGYLFARPGFEALPAPQWPSPADLS